MKRAQAQWLPWIALLLTVVFTAAGIWMLVATRGVDVGQRWGPRSFPIGFALGFGVMGTLIALRRPGNRIGWLFLWSGLVSGLQLFVENYAVYAVLAFPGSLPYGSGSRAPRRRSLSCRWSTRMANCHLCAGDSSRGWRSSASG